MATGAKNIIKLSMGENAKESLEVPKNNVNTLTQYVKNGIKQNSDSGITIISAIFKTFFGITIIFFDFMLQKYQSVESIFPDRSILCVESDADTVASFNKYPGRLEIWYFKDESEIGAGVK